MLIQSDAGIAQLVERNLAKVEVASSRLVSRSIFLVPSSAGWQSGHAAACKAVYAGSIPTPAFKFKGSLLVFGAGGEHVLCAMRRSRRESL